MWSGRHPPVRRAGRPFGDSGGSPDGGSGPVWWGWPDPWCQACVCPAGVAGMATSMPPSMTRTGDRDRTGGRRSGRDPARQLESRAVQPAFDLAVLDVTVGERDLSVAADVEQGMDPPLAAGQTDRVPGQVEVHSRLLSQLGQGTGWNPYHADAGAQGGLIPSGTRSALGGGTADHGLHESTRGERRRAG